MGLDHRPWWRLPLLVKGTGKDAIGAIGTALVIIGGYASFSISGSLSLLLLVSPSGYASAFTDAYGSLYESNLKRDRFDRPGLGWWIEWRLNRVITAAMDVQPLYLFLLNKGGDGFFLSEPPIGSESLFFTFYSRHDPGVQSSRSNHGFSSRRGKLVGWLKCGYAGWTKVKWEVASSNV